MTPEAQPHQEPPAAGQPCSGANRPSLIEAQDTADTCQRAQELDVGQLTPAELDSHITSLGRLMVQANRLGDYTTRDRLAQLQAQARAARSPEHVARQDAEHLLRVEEGVGYFASAHALEQGRQAMGGRS